MALSQCIIASCLLIGTLAVLPQDMMQRIMDGDDAEKNEFPSQVFLYSHIVNPWNRVDSYIICGGSIISEKWVLTAAHCVNSSVRTVVGAGSRHRGELWSPSRSSVARRIIVHEKYRLFGRNDNNAADDLALLELQRPLSLDAGRMAAARLASKGQTVPSERGVVVGWGRRTYDPTQKQIPDILQKLNVDVIPCPENTTEAICIRSPEGSGVCTGDSGGPLFVNGTLFGVASYLDHPDKTIDPNRHCGNVDSWAVFMEVPSYRQWIKKYSGI